MSNVYGLFGTDLYSIQNPGTIKEFVGSLPKQRCSVTSNSASSAYEANITLVGVAGDTTSNYEYYQNVLQYISDMQIEDMGVIRDQYKIMVDFTLSDGGGNVIDEGIRVYRLQSVDMAVMNTLNSSDELTYRRAKKLSMNMMFKYPVATSFGISYSNSSKKYNFQINNIQVMADTYSASASDAYTSALRAPIIDKTLSRKSQTVKTLSENMTLIYDSSENDIEFDTIEMGTKPREFTIRLEVLLNNFFEINDPSDLESLLASNAGDDVPPVEVVKPKPPVPDDDPCNCHCDPKYHAMWKRYDETDPMKYLVVAADIADEDLDETCMVKIDDKKLQHDIPDIEVGEYVYYKEFLDW